MGGIRQPFQLRGDILAAVLMDQNSAGGLIAQDDLQMLTGRSDLRFKRDGISVYADIFQQLAAAVGGE